jgi:hypothetical protein
MTLKLDPTTHSFGMAYTVGGGIFYPSYFCKRGDSYRAWGHLVNGNSTYYEVEELTRAPEHDLIHTAVVAEMIRDALDSAWHD